MSREIINMLILTGCFLTLFFLAELLYYKWKVHVDTTRKMVHVGTGFLTLLFPIMLGNHWFVLLLCASFGLLLIGSLKFKLLKSINAIDRVSYGSLLFPVAVYCCYLVYHHYAELPGNQPDTYIYFYAPILTLAICDPIAALVGKRFPFGRFKVGKGHKTLMGSSAFFISSLFLIFVLFTYFESYSINLGNLFLASALFAGIGTTTEAFSRNGLDNLFIPLMVVFMLILLS